MSLTVMGDQTKTIFLKGVEAHKLHHEFTVGSGNTVIKRGQPVVLNNDGTVTLVKYITNPRDEAYNLSVEVGEESLQNMRQGEKKEYVEAE